MSDNVCDKTNVQSELLLVGSFYKKPDLYITYGRTIRSKYDFSDNATRFFYDMFENYYLSFSQEIEVTENKINTFATQNQETLKSFKSFGGWRTIKEMMNLADPHDIKYVYNTVKKYSLIREYDKSGFPAEKILAFKDFQKLSASDVYRLIRAKADKVNTIINVMDEPEILQKGLASMVDGLIEAPQMGYLSPFNGYNDYFRGCLKGTTLFYGGTSNIGKSRNATMLLGYLALVQKIKVMLLSTEMTLQSIKQAFLVTAINNPEFQALHGVQVSKSEKELSLGLYRDAKGNLITRRIDPSTGEIESEENYLSRVYSSIEYQKVKKVAQWVEQQLEGKFYFNDISSDYSAESIELEMRKASVVYGCQVICIDTLKNYQNAEWGVLKQTATKICEVTKENNNFYTLCTFQLRDEALNMPIEDINSNQIGESKAIKHVADCMTLSKRLDPQDYYKYQYIPYDTWGDAAPIDLDSNKDYIATKIEKNRLSGAGNILLFEVNLDTNVWNNVGCLIRKQ